MCGKYVKNVRLRISSYYLQYLYTPRRGYDVDFFDWDNTGKECTASFRCSDDFIDISLNHTKEELEEYVITTFGANIISDKMSNSSSKWNSTTNVKNNFLLNTIVGDNKDNPALKLLPKSKRDSYRSEYDLELTKTELQNFNYHLKQLHKSLRDKASKPSKRKGDNYMVKIGTW